MLEVCLLGTGGMVPLPKRHLTSLMTRYNGNNVLIDCGEGTQVAIKEKGWSPYPISLILITHFHADHISGLPGLLLTLGNCERVEPLIIAGPKGLKNVVNALRIIAPSLPYEINYIEYDSDYYVFNHKDYKITAFRVNHRVECYGYKIEVERAGKFNPDKAKENDIPLKFWSRLQKGETIVLEDKIYEPSMVMGEKRKGLKIVYSTDTRPTKMLENEAVDADILICEGMYGFHEKASNAKKYKHMSMLEAVNIAVKSKPKKLWFTHYSPSNVNPKQYESKLRELFNDLDICNDGHSVDLMFDDGE